MSMCTVEDVQKIVHDELQKERGRFITQFWYVIIGMVISVLGSWFSLYFQVQNLQETAINSDLVLQRQIDTLRIDYKADMLEIKSDIRLIREALTR